MSERGVISRLIAKARALLAEDWLGSAGERFSTTADAISDFAEEHALRPGELADEAVSLARSALHGKANKDFAVAAKDFADAENTKIEAELKKRSLQSRVQKEEAEAALVRLQVVHAEADLIAKLQILGVALRRDEHGNITALPAPKTFNFSQLADQRLAPMRIEAERMVLGAILLDNAAFPQVSRLLTVEDFSLDEHRAIFLAIATLGRRRAAIDYVTLVNELERSEKLQSAGGVSYITSLQAKIALRTPLLPYIEFILRRK